MNNATTAAAVVLLGLTAAAFKLRQVPAGDVEPDQATGFLDDVWVTFDPSTYMTGDVDSSTTAANERAFLDAIAFAEGTARENGYRTMFGYRTFYSYADHPRQYFSYTNKAGQTIRTSAAGRYQIIVKTWDTIRARLGLVDFSPASQDAAALELIRERGALNDVRAGRIAAAVDKVAPVWSSLPGANVDQPMRSLGDVLSAYQTAGGNLA